MINTVATLYNLLQINRKIERVEIRYMYLKKVWGLTQEDIAELETVSQSYVSKILIHANKTVSHETFLDYTSFLYSGQEIEFIQMLPREIISDVQVIAFIENILGVKPQHPFFTYYMIPDQMRIAALDRMGIQNKHLMQIFGKNQATVSMSAKRNGDKALAIEKMYRYDKQPEYKLENQKLRENMKAGGN